MPQTVDHYAKVLRQAATDPAFRRRLIADAPGTLKASGIDVPAGIEIKVVEDTGSVVHLVLPTSAAADDELSDIELDWAAGGIGNTYCGKIVES
jgi:Nitrile hydratase, alpha chain